jgi:hypothetical protein
LSQRPFDRSPDERAVTPHRPSEHDRQRESRATDSFVFERIRPAEAVREHACAKFFLNAVQHAFARRRRRKIAPAGRHFCMSMALRKKFPTCKNIRFHRSFFNFSKRGRCACDVARVASQVIATLRAVNAQRSVDGVPSYTLR